MEEAPKKEKKAKAAAKPKVDASEAEVAENKQEKAAAKELEKAAKKAIADAEKAAKKAIADAEKVAKKAIADAEKKAVKEAAKEEKKAAQEAAKKEAAKTEEVTEEEEISVKKFEFQGTTYLRSSENVMYDSTTQYPVGMWNEEEQCIDEIEEEDDE